MPCITKVEQKVIKFIVLQVEITLTWNICIVMVPMLFYLPLKEKYGFSFCFYLKIIIIFTSIKFISIFRK